MLLSTYVDDRFSSSKLNGLLPNTVLDFPKKIDKNALT
jgi:hypothetical protein